MICPSCSAHNDNDAIFCVNCGFRLQSAPPAAAPPTYQVPPTYQAPPTYQIPAQPQAPQGYQPPQSYQPFGAPGYPPIVANSTAATISLIFGVASWFALPVIGAIVAVVAGHMARAEIRRSNGAIGGDGLARAGLILGYIHLILFAVAVCAGLAFFIFLVSNSAASI